MVSGWLSDETSAEWNREREVQFARAGFLIDREVVGLRMDTATEGQGQAGRNEKQR